MISQSHPNPQNRLPGPLLDPPTFLPGSLPSPFPPSLHSLLPSIPPSFFFHFLFSILFINSSIVNTQCYNVFNRLRVNITPNACAQS